MSNKTVKMICVGDIILGNSSEPYFESVLPVLEDGDVVMGHLEVPYTDRTSSALELERHPNNLAPLKDKANFDILTLAGNHLADDGVEGIEDTIQWLKENKIHYSGGGMNIEEAKKPAIVERSGVKVGVLKYNCVGPSETWATPEKPGCAYVNILTHYELEHANPGGPPAISTHAEPKSLQEMKDDIVQLRKKCDVLVVSFHKGLVHQPMTIAEYEQQVSYAAIDAGADLIVGEHAHLLKGIEFYKGKPIYHGLCNFIAYVPSLFPTENDDHEEWSRKRIELFGFSPDPEYPTYPFHPEAIYTIIAKFNIENGYIVRTGFVPCIVNKEGKPIVVQKENGGQEVFDYMKKVTDGANLNSMFEWDGDKIIAFEK